MGYNWRQMSEAQRQYVLANRKRQGYPWHSPPHRFESDSTYHITAACFEHKPVIGHSADRIQDFCCKLTSLLIDGEAQVFAWCVLPNHYHLLIQADRIKHLFSELGKFHGRTSFAWNKEDRMRGRQVWCNAVERAMKSDRHYLATLNYVHHNPVRHGYARKWCDWPYTSAHEYLSNVGRDGAARVWRQYPILDYGKGWDDPTL